MPDGFDQAVPAVVKKCVFAPTHRLALRAGLPQMQGSLYHSRRGGDMKAFGIFAGGGVKGAAFAGCLKAAEERGIEFVGYGGTSAGAIAGLLSTVGYSSDELKEILVDQPFSNLLDESLEDLRRLVAIPQMLQKGLLSGVLTLWWKHQDLMDQLTAQFGLNSGQTLKKFLDEKVRAKFPELEEVPNITFRHLTEVGCVDLKVLTSDLQDRCPRVYSVDTHPEAYVVDVVRASISHPFVFQPVMMGGRRLMDGGLSCNLPLSLFYRERRQTNIPVIAFDLLSAPAAVPPQYEFPHFLGDMTATALESSESMLWEIIDGVYHVIVEVPAGIRTFDFELTKAQRESLYEAGYTATSEKLSSMPQWFQAMNKIEEIRAQYASEAVVHRLLAAIAHDIEARSPPRDLRMNVMFPIAGEKLRIIYQFGMDGDADANIELDIDGGCAGEAFTTAKPVSADLAQPKQDAALIEEWNMTLQQQGLVRPDRNAVFSVPLFDTWATGEGDAEQRQVRAVLNVDTSTPIEETLWRNQDDPGYRAIMEWSDVVASVLFAK
jgi:NTE family protein